jgi:hypothetical protein
VDRERRALEDRLRLPLVSADARTVASGPRSLGDGEGTALLTLTDVDTDRDVRSIAIRPGDPDDVARARIAEAQAALDALGAAPLRALEVSADPTGKERVFGLGSAVPMAAQGEGLRVRYHEPQLLVDEEGGRVILRRAFPGWSYRVSVAGQRCLVLADLRAAWAGRGQGVLLLEIGYSGSPHFCSFPPGLHAVRLPRR